MSASSLSCFSARARTSSTRSRGDDDHTIVVAHDEIAGLDRHVRDLDALVESTRWDRVLPGAADTEAPSEHGETDLEKTLAVPHAAVDHESRELPRSSGDGHDLAPIARLVV